MLWFRRHRCDPAIFEDIAKLRRNIENLELEWVNFYDKAKRMMGRIAKRAEVVEHAEQGTNGESVQPPVQTALPGRMLSPRQVEIQQAILRRRANGAT